jgi:AcrR family transcriptional regulator
MSALEAFSSKGFHAATTREIGARAGMSPAAVYVHYSSKQELLYDISRLGHETSLRTVERALEQAHGPAERVHAFVVAFAKWHADNHVLARVIQYEFQNLPSHQLRKIIVIRSTFETLLKEELSRGEDAGTFVIADIPRTAVAILSLCIDLARWYEPTRENTSESIAELYAQLARRMLDPRAA